MQHDFYGDRFKYFIGVVKDTKDPLSSGRVRVRAKGIHPEDEQGDGGGSPGDNGASGASPGGSTGSGTSSETPSSLLTPKSPISPSDNLPSNRETTAKISKYFSLGDLTTGAHVTGRNCEKKMNELTPTIIKNLANIAVNILDPLKEGGVNVIINSGWRPVGTSAHTTNHGQGYAVDIKAAGMSIDNLYYYIMNHLKGRYSFLYNEKNHIHIQFQSTPGHNQGSLSSPLNRVK